MRSHLFLVAALGLCLPGAVADADTRSNPPFLGIGLDDGTALQRGVMGVFVTLVTPGTGAQRAGIQTGDIITGIDDVALLDAQQFSAWSSGRQSATAPAQIQKGPAETLVDKITGHEIGDQVHLSVLRNGRKEDIAAVLSSRADLLHRNLAGHELDIQVHDVDADRDLNLGSLAGRPTVVGWVFHERQSSRACTGCTAVLDKIEDRLHKLHPSDAPRVLAVTNESLDVVQKERRAVGSSLPTMIADTEAMKTGLGFADPERLHLTIVDCHGIVRFVALLMPGASDEDAVIDEIVSAVDQCEHRARRT